jgi:DNA topoisomerase-6 subunit B
MDQKYTSAEELAEGQESISISEFFEKNRQMLGFDSPARAIVTAIKEGVDNSLDATEESRILPDVYVGIEEKEDYYEVIIEDNGPGIVEENIPKVFGKLLYGSRFQKRVQSRGQQGIGISAAVLYSQITTGEPTEVKSKTMSQDMGREFRVIIDTETNEPEIKSKEKFEWDKEHGTRIKMKMEANMRSRSRLLDYIKSTAIVNPHARVEYEGPQKSLEFDRVTDEVPDKPEEIRPHPHGVNLGGLMKMIEETKHYSVRGFIKNEFTKVGDKTAQNILDSFRDRHYGREMSWKTSNIDEDNFEERIFEGVSRKKDEEIKAFSDGILSRLKEIDRVSYSEMREIFSETAEEVEEEYDTKFGDTVREKAMNEAWPILNDYKYNDIRELIDEATSKRKTGEVIDYMTYCMASEFSQAREKDRIRPSELEEFIKNSAELVSSEFEVSIGETSRENIFDKLWEVSKTVPEDIPKIKEFKSDRNMCRDLIEGMNETQVNRPSSKCLSPIGEELIEEGLRKEYDADFYSSTTRNASVYKGAPFIIEAGIAFGGDIEKDRAELIRYANKVPLVYQRGACLITDVTKNIGWRNYGLDQSDNSLPQDELVLMVHVASTNVPFTSQSKDAVASTPELETEVERAIREVSRDLKSYINKRDSLNKKREKRNVVTKLMPKFAEKISEITGDDEPDYHDSLSKIVKSILIEKDEDGLSIVNHLDSKEEIKIKISLEEEYDYNDDIWELNEDDMSLVWSGNIPEEEELELEYATEKEEDIEVLEIENEKYDMVE